MVTATDAAVVAGPTCIGPAEVSRSPASGATTTQGLPLVSVELPLGETDALTAERVTEALPRGPVYPFAVVPRPKRINLSSISIVEYSKAVDDNERMSSNPAPSNSACQDTESDSPLVTYV